jgi:regulator of protease activity HflC (stomatin/prohibitin superfamily)
MPQTLDPMLAAAVGAAVVLVLLLASLRRVPQGFEYTLERFGRYRRLLKPGLRFALIGVDRIGARIDVRERALRLPRSEALARDRIPVTVEAVAFYQVVDAAKAAYEVDDLEASLRALLSVSLRTLVGERDLDALLADRAGLNAALLAAADDSAAVWGVSLTRTEVGELAPPDALVLAARDAREAELKQAAEARAADAEREARRRRTESEQDAALADARTRAELARLEAEAGELVAEGDARATLMLSRALQEGDVRALNYLLARQYVDALKTLAESDNGRFVILPLETGGVAASLTGIRELAEATFPDLADPDEDDGADADAAAPASVAAEVPSPTAVPGAGLAAHADDPRA